MSHAAGIQIQVHQTKKVTLLPAMLEAYRDDCLFPKEIQFCHSQGCGCVNCLHSLFLSESVPMPPLSHPPRVSIHSFNKQLCGVCFVPGTVLGTTSITCGSKALPWSLGRCVGTVGWRQKINNMYNKSGNYQRMVSAMQNKKKQRRPRRMGRFLCWTVLFCVISGGYSRCFLAKGKQLQESPQGGLSLQYLRNKQESQENGGEKQGRAMSPGVWWLWEAFPSILVGGVEDGDLQGLGIISFYAAFQCEMAWIWKTAMQVRVTLGIRGQTPALCP